MNKRRVKNTPYLPFIIFVVFAYFINSTFTAVILYSVIFATESSDTCISLFADEFGKWKLAYIMPFKFIRESECSRSSLHQDLVIFQPVFNTYNKHYWQLNRNADKRRNVLGLLQIKSNDFGREFVLRI